MSAKKKMTLVVGTVAALILAVAGFILYSHSSDYIPLSQFQARSEKYFNRQISVSGKISPGTISWDDKSQIMKFELEEGPASLAVVYAGLVPGNFKPGSEIVVNGKYAADGTVQAESFGKIRSVCSICH